jgi:hypothetical protein
MWRTLFPARRSRPGAAASAGRARQARPGVERLEARDAASTLAFGWNSYIAGKATLNGSTTANSAPLAGHSYYGTVAGRQSNGYDLSSADASAGYSDAPGQTRQIEVKTFANASGPFRSATAQSNTTTQWNGGPGYITVNINPTRAGEYGKRVLVTLTATFMASGYGTNGVNYADVAYSPGGYGSTDLINTALYNQTGTIRRSASFWTTVGSSFRILETAYSSVGNGSSRGADVKLDVTIQNFG